MSLSMLASRLICASACWRQDLRSAEVWSSVPDGRVKLVDGLANREQPVNAPIRTRAHNLFVMTKTSTNQGLNVPNVVPLRLLCNRNPQSGRFQSNRPNLARS